MKQWIIFIFSFFLTSGGDQLSKKFAGAVSVNPGISFGILSNPGLSVLLVGVLVLIARLYGKYFFRTSAVATGIFFGASVSNILDRLFFGGVRDFLPIPFLSLHNNLADWGIFLSLLWIFFRLHQSSDINTV